MAVEDSRVLVVGAGIGGLSAAVACRRAGIDVAVLEKSPEVAAVGAGVGLWVDGMLALRALELEQEVQQAGSNYGVVLFRNSAGRVLARLEVGEIAGRYGAPAPVMVRRPELLRVFLEAVGPGVVQAGREVVGVEHDADGVTVRLADGGEERGAVAIGADGLESTMRPALAGKVERRYAGYQYLRLLTRAGEDSVPVNTFSMTVGKGDRVGLSHTGGGWRYLFGVLAVPQGTGDPPGGPKADLQQRFSGFPDPIPEVIDESPAEAIFRTDIFDIKPLGRWGEGRATMLGDAAHGMTPNMGRGAGEAIQDAVSVVRALESAGSLTDGQAVAAALRAYEADRREATNEVHAASWRSGKLMSVKAAPLRLFRDQLMARVIGPQMVKGLEGELKSL